VQGKNWGKPETGPSTSGVLSAMTQSVFTRFKLVLHGSAIHRLAAKFGLAWPPPVGAIDFGHFGTPRPISQDFGWDRGTPVDRYYITRFLAASAQEIAGRVLEIGDDEYSRTFGGSKITHQDVLHLDPANPKATLTGDLTRPSVLPRDTFDCIILTQTLQLIFHLDQAIANLHGALKSGGVLLLTVPGMSQVDRGEWGGNWCWSFTDASIRQLFGPRFGIDRMTIQSFGNVFAATTFLQGLALEEINQSNLEQHDPAYPVIVTLRARKL
jgi:SAM-dependent methyltransferase